MSTAQCEKDYGSSRISPAERACICALERGQCAPAWRTRPKEFLP